jgi:hypothetical protein
MAIVKPFHTNSDREPAEQREVYHDNSHCRIGIEICRINREPGTGGKRPCALCIKLNWMLSL